MWREITSDISANIAGGLWPQLSSHLRSFPLDHPPSVRLSCWCMVQCQGSSWFLPSAPCSSSRVSFLLVTADCASNSIYINVFCFLVLSESTVELVTQQGGSTVDSERNFQHLVVSQASLGTPHLSTITNTKTLQCLPHATHLGSFQHG